MYLTDYEAELRARGRTEGLGDDGLGFLPIVAVATAAPGLISGVASLFGGGGKYRGGPFVPDGLQNWAATGHEDFIRQVATTGKGPHWSEPDKHGIIQYAGSDQLAAQQFLAQIVAQRAANTAPSPAASSPYPDPYGPDLYATVNAPGGAPAVTRPAAGAPPAAASLVAGIPTWGIVAGGAALAYLAFFRKKRNPRRAGR
jgi:hypothetical protein